MNALQISFGAQELIVIMDAHGGIFDGWESQGWNALSSNVPAVGGTGADNGVDLKATINIQIVLGTRIVEHSIQTYSSSVAALKASQNGLESSIFVGAT